MVQQESQTDAHRKKVRDANKKQSKTASNKGKSGKHNRRYNSTFNNKANDNNKDHKSLRNFPMMMTALFMVEATNGGSVIRTSTVKTSAQDIQLRIPKEAPINHNALLSVKVLQIKSNYSPTKVGPQIKALLVTPITVASEAPTAELPRQDIQLLIHQMVITNIENNFQPKSTIMMTMR